ncbi:MAG: hypothetical protein ACKVWV_04845 [Planctomycetota bacterium]
MKHTPTLPVRVGVYRSIKAADAAVDRLVLAGFAKDHITVICPRCDPEHFSDVEQDKPAGANTPSAAISGGAIGALFGGAVAVASVAATGGTSLLLFGPLFAGIGGGAVAGGLIGAMMTRGFEREVADFYDQAVQKGKVLVAVEDKSDQSDERLARAEEILASAGAEPIALTEG